MKRIEKKSRWELHENATSLSCTNPGSKHPIKTTAVRLQDMWSTAREAKKRIHKQR